MRVAVELFQGLVGWKRQGMRGMQKFGDSVGVGQKYGFILSMSGAGFPHRLATALRRFVFEGSWECKDVIRRLKLMANSMR